MLKYDPSVLLSVIMMNKVWQIYIPFISQPPTPVPLALPPIFPRADGGICFDILQNKWSPTYDVHVDMNCLINKGDELKIPEVAPFHDLVQGQERLQQGHAATLRRGACQRAHQQGHEVREPGQHVHLSV